MPGRFEGFPVVTGVVQQVPSADKPWYGIAAHDEIDNYLYPTVHVTPDNVTALDTAAMGTTVTEVTVASNDRKRR